MPNRFRSVFSPKSTSPHALNVAEPEPSSRPAMLVLPPIRTFHDLPEVASV